MRNVLLGDAHPLHVLLVCGEPLHGNLQAARGEWQWGQPENSWLAAACRVSVRATHHCGARISGHHGSLQVLHCANAHGRPPGHTGCAQGCPVAASCEGLHGGCCGNRRLLVCCFWQTTVLGETSRVRAKGWAAAARPGQGPRKGGRPSAHQCSHPRHYHKTCVTVVSGGFERILRPLWIACCPSAEQQPVPGAHNPGSARPTCRSPSLAPWRALAGLDQSTCPASAARQHRALPRSSATGSTLSSATYTS